MEDKTFIEMQLICQLMTLKESKQGEDQQDINSQIYIYANILEENKSNLDHTAFIQYLNDKYINSGNYSDVITIVKEQLL